MERRSIEEWPDVLVLSKRNDRNLSTGEAPREARGGLKAEPKSADLVKPEDL